MWTRCKRPARCLGRLQIFVNNLCGMRRKSFRSKLLQQENLLRCANIQTASGPIRKQHHTVQWDRAFVFFAPFPATLLYDSARFVDKDLYQLFTLDVIIFGNILNICRAASGPFSPNHRPWHANISGSQFAASMYQTRKIVQDKPKKGQRHPSGCLWKRAVNVPANAGELSDDGNFSILSLIASNDARC